MGGRRKIRRALLACGLPEDAMMNSACVTLNGRTSLRIEGHQGVMELSCECIRLYTGCGVLAVRGERLELRALSACTAVISGEAIASVAYL